MKVGDLVIYSEGGVEYNALVLGERVIEQALNDSNGKPYTSSISGKGGEPLLSLAFAKEQRDAAGIPLSLHGTGHQEKLVQVRLDVAHVSQAYDDAQKAFYRQSAYPGGRWKTSVKSAAGSPAQLRNAWGK
jgi:hypothetical protein